MRRGGVLGVEADPYRGCSIEYLRKTVQEVRNAPWLMRSYPRLAMLLVGAEQARRERKRPPFRPGEKVVVKRESGLVRNCNLSRRTRPDDILLDHESGEQYVSQIYFIPRLFPLREPWYLGIVVSGRGELLYPAEKFERA